jgi:dihydroorotate dehydrogenase (NAD+) catalytic subunit
MVWDVARSVDIPVVGIGGIMSADDALEFLCAGASAVQVGTAHYRRPDAIPRMLEAMRASLAAAGRAEVRSVIKTLRVP